PTVNHSKPVGSVFSVISSPCCIRRSRCSACTAASTPHGTSTSGLPLPPSSRAERGSSTRRRHGGGRVAARRVRVPVARSRYGRFRGHEHAPCSSTPSQRCSQRNQDKQPCQVFLSMVDRVVGRQGSNLLPLIAR